MPIDDPAAILVIDDDPINRTLLTRSLMRDGHRVRSAANGRLGLALLEDVQFDCILLDVLMPEMDGFEVLEHLRASRRLRHVPVIVISGLEENDTVVRCLEMGAEDYLTKPFDPVLLRARISGGLARKRLRDLERDRVRGLFARFVPEAVVDQVLASTDEYLRLGGERRDVTVMFSDVRDFTKFAETRPPDQVIEVLNRYLTLMSDVIQDHGGTLISYMGDGIMAVFGAPIELSDHADRAVLAARRMSGETLDRFNEALRSEGTGDGFRIGVGLNSGPAMAGNVGSERRLEYTAIGDTTNTASRVERLTKRTGHMVLMTEATQTRLGRQAREAVPVGAFEVRGRREPIKAWTLREPPRHADVRPRGRGRFSPTTRAPE
jgi:adenylate cyclase